MSDPSIYVVLAIYAVLQVIWTLAVRKFPDLVGGVLLKGVERRNAIKIEAVKDELSRKTQSEIERIRADYATLKSSTDFLSANQAELRSKMIASTERLWSSMLAIQKELFAVIFLEGIALPNELEDAFARGTWPQLLAKVQDYKSEQYVTTKLLQIENDELPKARLFVGDRLWLIYYIFKAVCFRTALLVNQSFVHARYNGWRDDGLIQQHLKSVFNAEQLKPFFAKEQPTFNLVVAALEAKFLEEAMRVMSGSKYFAESFSDVQSTLLYEAARVRADKEVR